MFGRIKLCCRTSFMQDWSAKNQETLKCPGLNRALKENERNPGAIVGNRKKEYRFGLGLAGRQMMLHGSGWAAELLTEACCGLWKFTLLWKRLGTCMKNTPPHLITITPSLPDEFHEVQIAHVMGKLSLQVYTLLQALHKIMRHLLLADDR